MSVASTYPLVPVEDALKVVLEHVQVLGVESVPLEHAAGRVLAEDVVADLDLPRWRVSAVDGYALRASEGSEAREVIGESAAGRPFANLEGALSAVRILTGGVVPEGADAVVMQEDTEWEGGRVRPARAPVAGANIHEPGADVRRGEVVLARSTALGAPDLGLAGTLGRAELNVHRRPRVALLSTGDELVEVGQPLAVGQVPDSNRFALLAALREVGAVVEALGVAPDEPASLRRLVESALERNDVLVTSGGVSVGTHDLVKPLLESMGQVHVGRVKLRPGKPFTFATLPGGRVAFGLPGFPVSSLVTLEVFVRPALLKMQGASQLHRPRLRVRLAYDAKPPGDRDEFQRVTLRMEDGTLAAHSTGSQSSSRLMSIAGAHALVRVPAGGDGFRKGEAVEAMILSLP